MKMQDNLGTTPKPFPKTTEEGITFCARTFEMDKPLLYSDRVVVNSPPPIK